LIAVKSTLPRASKLVADFDEVCVMTLETWILSAILVAAAFLLAYSGRRQEPVRERERTPPHR